MLFDSGVALFPSSPGEHPFAHPVPPEQILQGRLMQRTFRKEDGELIEFTLVLSIVDAVSGVQIWKGARNVGFQRGR
jgi:hypothetical protein